MQKQKLGIGVEKMKHAALLCPGKHKPCKAIMGGGLLEQQQKKKKWDNTKCRFLQTVELMVVKKGPTPLFDGSSSYSGAFSSYSERKHKH